MCVSVCVCRLLQIMCTCPLSALLHFVFWFALRVSLCAYFLFYFVASLLRLQCWGLFCVGSAIKCIIYMHSSDLVATANFTAHSTGTAQHLPFLPTCVCVRKRESVRNTLLTLCKSVVWGLPTATSHGPLSYLKISKLQPCDSVVKWTTACEPNYPNYAYLKIHIKIFVSYKRKRSEPTSLITSTLTSTSTSTASASVSFRTDRGKGIGSWCPKLLCSTRDWRTGWAIHIYRGAP